MYSRVANVIFTDNHLIAHSKVFERENFDENNPIFEKTKKLFHEELFESSRLPNYIETQKSVLKTQLGKIFKNSAKILESVNKNSHSDKNNPAGIILLIFIIGGLLFAIMMGITYFIGVPVVYLLAGLYARIMHKTKKIRLFHRLLKQKTTSGSKIFPAVSMMLSKNSIFLRIRRLTILSHSEKCSKSQNIMIFLIFQNTILGSKIRSLRPL